MSNTHDLVPLIESTPDLAWLPRAACADFGLDRLSLFFVEAGRTLSKEAAAVCGSCQVRVDCLRHAYDNEIEGGYFGGLSSAKRRALTFEQAVESIRP